MKSKLLIFCLFVLFVSCSGDKSNPVKNDSKITSIVGSWLISELYIQYPSGVEKITPAEYNTYGYMRFYADGKFVAHQKFGRLAFNDKGTYRLVGTSRLELQVQDLRKPDIYHPSTITIQKLSPTQMDVKAVAYEFDAQDKVLMYDAVIVYTRQ